MAAKQVTDKDNGQDILSEGEKKYFDHFQELEALRKSVYGKMNWWPQNVFLPDKEQHIERKRQLLLQSSKPQKENLDEKLRNLYRQQGDKSRISQQQQKDQKEMLQEQKQKAVERPQQQQKVQEKNPRKKQNSKQKNKQQQQRNKPLQVQHLQQGKPQADLTKESNGKQDQPNTFKGETKIGSVLSRNQASGKHVNPGCKTGLKENFNGSKRLTDSSSSDEDMSKDEDRGQFVGVTNRPRNGQNGRPATSKKQKTLTDTSSSSDESSSCEDTSSKVPNKTDVKANAQKGHVTSSNGPKNLTDSDSDTSSSSDKNSSKVPQKKDVKVNSQRGHVTSSNGPKNLTDSETSSSSDESSSDESSSSSVGDERENSFVDVEV